MAEMMQIVDIADEVPQEDQVVLSKNENCASNKIIGMVSWFWSY